MDPVSCVALATGSFKALKAAIGAGKDLQDMSGTLSQWGKAFSDLLILKKEKKIPLGGNRHLKVVTKKQL